MKQIIGLLLLFSILALNQQCTTPKTKNTMKGTFGYDLEFLLNYKNTTVLKSPDGKAQVAIVGDYQGRVMTSSSNGLSGRSYGWINYDLISSDTIRKQINIYGGEDRFWIGPEGGQYSIFFKQGDSFTFENWNTPALIDTEAFQLIKKNETSAEFSKNAHLINYSNTEFIFTINRKISLLSQEETEDILGININPEIQWVGYASENKITNTGKTQWKKDKGLLSIWILGMFTPSDHTVIVIPFKPLNDASSLIRDNYFGKVPADRLIIKDNVLFFKGDGKARGKIGIPPSICKPVFGSYDTKNNILTIIQFDFNEDSDYVNSLWEIQKEPYDGDVINSYNDGPLADGSQLGPFYELETSSPAKELKPGETIVHTHRTFHFEGNKETLDTIAYELLGVELEEIKNVFN